MLLPEGNLSGANVVSALATTADSIRKLPNIINQATSRLQFQEEMAKFLSTQDGHGEGDYEQYMDPARYQLDANQCRAFTNSKSEAWFLAESAGGIAQSDIIHETIHIMCAKGGEGEVLKALGTSFNEGATQLFTIQICNQLGVPVKEAYPQATNFNQKLYKKYPTELYAAYFKQDVDALYAAMLENWEGLAKQGKLADNSNTPWSERGPDKWKGPERGARRIDLINNLSSLQTKEGWLNARVL